LSPDEKQVAIEAGGDLYIIEQVSEGFDQLRPFVTEAGSPLWSWDGEWLYYSSAHGKEIWKKKKADFQPGRGERVYVVEEGLEGHPMSESLEYLMVQVNRLGGGDSDILRVDLKGGAGEAEVMYGEDYTETWPEISPDEKWLTYYTSELGHEIYVAPMDGSRGGQMVSNGGGLRPRWSGSGEEIYYRWGSSIYSVRVIDGEGQFKKGEPKEVVAVPFDIYEFQWTVSKDGERFLMLVDTAYLDEGTNGDGDSVRKPTHLKLVTNWFTELNELVPLDGE